MNNMAYIEGKTINKERSTSPVIKTRIPRNNFYIDVKLVTIFKSNVSVQQSSSLFNLTTLAQTELQGPVNTMYK